MEKIELVNPMPELEEDYRKIVWKAIRLNLITLDEWNKRFKFYRDDCGYSFIHFLSCVMGEVDTFVTINPIMIDNRKELMERFGIEILNLEKFEKKLKEKNE